MELSLSAITWEKVSQLSQDLFCVLDENGVFVHLNDPSMSILGYSSEDLQGIHFSEILQSGSYAPLQEMILDKAYSVEPIKIKTSGIHKNGSIIHLHWSIIWSEDDNSYLCLIRDDTELVKSRTKLEEDELLYNTLFENNPDVLFTQSIDGLVKEVNKSFCEVFGVSKEDALNRPTTSFLPPDMVPVCVNYFQASLAGSTSRYELELVTSKNERRIYDTVKFPVISKGEVVHVQTILKDITPVVRSYEKIKQQAEKLNIVFESMTDAFFTIDKEWNFTYINNEAEKLLYLDRHQHLGQNILKIFNEEVGGEFHSQYVFAFETGKSVNFTAYLKRLDVWFRVKAFPSSEGLSVYFDDVTENVKYRQELEELSIVASSISSGVIITDHERRIKWVNDAFTRLSGYKREDVLECLPIELLSFKRENKGAYDELINKFADGELNGVEILYNRTDGKDIWLSLNRNPIYGEDGTVTKFVYLLNDVTDKMKSRKELEKLSLVASKTNNSVLIADRDWKIEWVNDGFTRLTGYTLEDALGKKPSYLLHNDKTDKTSYTYLEEKLLAGMPISLDVINVKKNGEEVWLNIDITAIFDESGELSRFIEVQTDITSLKESELELARSARDLYRHNKDLQQFTYIVSHNLRAPVANVLGLSDMLLKLDKSSDLYDRSVANLRLSALNLDSVIKDMNTVLSIRDSKGTLEKEQIYITNVIEQALASLQEPLESCGGTILNCIDTDLTTYTNKAYLYSIFCNLLSNAIKYRAEDRGLKITLKCFGNSEHGLVISVADNGSGFDLKKAKDNVFKLYKRFHTGKTGTGIGLYLIKTHLEAMGGHVEVNSEVGIGTRFLIFLPGYKNEHTHH